MDHPVPRSDEGGAGGDRRCSLDRLISEPGDPAPRAGRGLDRVAPATLVTDEHDAVGNGRRAQHGGVGVHAPERLPSAEREAAELLVIARPAADDLAGNGRRRHLLSVLDPACELYVRVPQAPSRAMVAHDEGPIAADIRDPPIDDDRR